MNYFLIMLCICGIILAGGVYFNRKGMLKKILKAAYKVILYIQKNVNEIDSQNVINIVTLCIKAIRILNLAIDFIMNKTTNISLRQILARVKAELLALNVFLTSVDYEDITNIITTLNDSIIMIKSNIISIAQYFNIDLEYSEGEVKIASVPAITGLEIAIDNLNKML